MSSVDYSNRSSGASIPSKRALNVTFTSTSYPATIEDWRGVFVRHIVDALARRPDVNLSVWAPPGPLPKNVEYLATPGEQKNLAWLMKAGGVSHLLREKRMQGAFAATSLMRGLNRAFGVGRPDVRHVNWLQCMLALPNDRIPALVTVLGNDMRLLRVAGVRSLLRRQMQRRRVVLCPNADWMLAPLNETFGDVATVASMPFGIHPDWFSVVRQPPSTPMWLAVTRLTRNKLGPLFEWSEPLFAGLGRTLNLIGPMQESITVPDWVRYHSAASPHELLTHWFPQATGLVTLSAHAEGRPQVLLEALAAGLPVIASPLDAHTDLIRENRGGRIVADPAAYADAIETLEQQETNTSTAVDARSIALRVAGTWDDCAQRYANVYRELTRSSYA